MAGWLPPSAPPHAHTPTAHTVRCAHLRPQIASGFSRMLAALLAALPPYRLNGDDATVQRLIKRPNSALEAGARAPMELLYGVTAAASGLLLDPMAVSRGGRDGEGGRRVEWGEGWAGCRAAGWPRGQG